MATMANGRVSPGTWSLVPGFNPVESRYQVVQLIQEIYTISGDKNISILLILQHEWLTIITRPANTYTCLLKAYTIKNLRG